MGNAYGLRWLGQVCVLAGLLGAANCNLHYEKTWWSGGGPGVGGRAAVGGAAGQISASGSSSVVQLKLLAFNDLHGQLAPPLGNAALLRNQGATWVTGGLAYFASYVRQARRQFPQALLLSAGDLVGASPLNSALFHDEPTLEIMNRLGLDVHAIGNHEFDKGLLELQRKISGGCHPSGCSFRSDYAGAAFPFVSANVRSRSEPNMPLFPAYTLREIRGIRIAIVGATLASTPQSVVAAHTRDLVFDKEVASVNALIPELQAQGAQVIVVLLHEGGTQSGDMNDCQNLTGPIVGIGKALSAAVTVILSAHTHQAYICTIDGKLLTSAASLGRALTSIDIWVDRDTGQVLQKQAQNIAITRDIAADPEIAQVIAEADALAEPLANQVIGSISENLSRRENAAGLSKLGVVIADAFEAAASPTLRQAPYFALTNSSGMRADLTYRAPGSVTYADAFAVQPFDNELLLLTLRGSQVLALLEQQFLGSQVNILQPSQNLNYRYWSKAQRGQHIDASSVKIAGAPLDLNAEYGVITNSFLAGGGSGFSVFGEATSSSVLTTDMAAFAAYLGQHSPLPPPQMNRVSVE